MDCLEQLASELVSSRVFFFCIPACLFDRCGIIPLVLFFLCMPFEIDCEKELSGDLVKSKNLSFRKPTCVFDCSEMLDVFNFFLLHIYFRIWFLCNNCL